MKAGVIIKGDLIPFIMNGEKLRSRENIDLWRTQSLWLAELGVELWVPRGQTMFPLHSLPLPTDYSVVSPQQFNVIHSW